MGRILAALSGIAALAIPFWTFPQADAAKLPAFSEAVFAATVDARFDPRARETRVAGRASLEECFLLILPQEWEARAEAAETRLRASSSGAELTVNLRSSDELRRLPQTDLASRDAALLQQVYESRLGRPAQSVSQVSLSEKTTRWSATWIDASLPAGRMTVETFIVPLSENWVLELFFENVGAEEEYDVLVRSLLTGLKLRQGSSCREPPAF